MTIQELLDTCRANFANVEIAYVHPTLYVFCLSDDFAGRDEDYQIEYFLRKCGVSEESFNRLVATATISLCLLRLSANRDMRLWIRLQVRNIGFHFWTAKLGINYLQHR